MFRPMRRIKNQISDKECIDLLKSEWRGVLAVHGEDGYPYALPIDFMYDDAGGKIYFHCAREGHKIDAVRNDSMLKINTAGKCTVRYVFRTFRQRDLRKSCTAVKRLLRYISAFRRQLYPVKAGTAGKGFIHNRTVMP